MRRTSIDSFHDLRDSGTLSKRQIEVLNLVKAAGSITGRAISRSIPGGHKRLAELEALGAVRACGPFKDPVTKKKVLLWESTNQPLMCQPPKEKRPTRKDLEAIIEAQSKVIAAYPYIVSTAYDRGYQMGVADRDNAIEWENI